MNTLRFHIALLVISLFSIFNAPPLKAQSPLDGFDPNVNGAVYAIVVQPDGKIIVGGDFTTVSPNGGAATARNRIVRFNPDGTLDPTFDPNASSDVESVMVQSDGKILVGGWFFSLAPNGGAMVTRYYIARLNTDGTVDMTFNPNPNDLVLSIAVQSDGRILIGGWFTSLAPNGGAPVARRFFARLSNDTAALSSLTVTKTAVTLTRNGAAALFTRVVFEQSLDNGANWTTLGMATNSFASPVELTAVDESIEGKSGVGRLAPVSLLTPQATGYTLSGLNLPAGQNILIRARLLPHGLYKRLGINRGQGAEHLPKRAFLSRVIILKLREL